MFKRIVAILLMTVMVISCVGCSSLGNEQVTDIENQEAVTLSLWYTDVTLTAYLEQVATEYQKSNQQVTIVPKLVDADQYLENMYNGSIKEENVADLYMLSSDNLEKAYLMGLVASNDTYSSEYTESVYGKAGVEAATYNDKLLGYPLSFETTVMVYNKKYAKPMTTFTEITNFSNNFKNTEENTDVEYIVKWDVSDIFTNYAFIGSYMNIGGASSDDNKKIQINSDNVKLCLGEYLKFKSDYGIERKTTTASQCIDLFSKNKLLYTLVKTSDLKAINQSGVEYGISKVPDLTTELKTKSMSTTKLTLVNPYSKNLKVAKSVAKAITYDYAQELYDLTGYTSVRCDLDNNPTSEYTNLYNIYSDSIVKAQFINIGDIYLRLEIMIHQVWDGTSIEESYHTFNNYLSTQLSTTVNTTK